MSPQPTCFSSADCSSNAAMKHRNAVTPGAASAPSSQRPLWHEPHRVSVPSATCLERRGKGAARPSFLLAEAARSECAPSMRAVKDSLAAPFRAKWGKSEGLRWTRAIWDSPRLPLLDQVRFQSWGGARREGQLMWMQSRSSWSDEALDEWRAGAEEDPWGMISVTGTSRSGSWGLPVMMYPLVV